MLKVETFILLLSSPLPVLPDWVIYRISFCTCDGGQTHGNLLMVLPLISVLLLLLSLLVGSNSLPLHGLQHARLPCSSPSPGACSNSRPLNRWCHPTISSSVISFPSCLQSFPATGSFPAIWLFTSGGQSIGAAVWWYSSVVKGTNNSVRFLSSRPGFVTA